MKDKVRNLLDLYAIIAQNRYPSISSIRERFSLSERSVHRYLKIIDSIDSIELDRERGGYKFVNGTRIRKLALSEGQFQLLMIMGEAAAHLGKGLKTEFEQFVETITSATNTPAAVSNPIVLKIPNAVESEKMTEYFTSILNCTQERRRIEVTYKGTHSGETKKRRLDPYGIVFHDGDWVLVGYCHLAEALRHFFLDRILDLKVTNFSFSKPADFDLERHFADSWGIWDAEPVEVTVRFSKEAAEHVTRKKQWHPSEKRKALPSGEVEMTFTVAGVKEIKKWIYSWVPNVEVIGPEWLREEVRNEFDAAVQKHG
ncbi:MAG: WYL domain-containing protein [Nitrospirae bacterium]|nr:WYL domain-containing protein [Nitrospirota bacterium]